jgi:hypothetical protein
VILLEEELHALGEFGDDLRLARQDRLPVEGKLLADDSEFLGVLEVIVDFRVEEQTLGRDAADVQTIAVFMPNWPERIAATYPPGPLPITTTSYLGASAKTTPPSEVSHL